VIDVDGSNAQRLTDDPAHDTLPAWTGDGSQLVFKSSRTGSWSIYIMNADGSGQTEIIKNVGMGNDWAFDRMDVY
jgi:TolB protein